MIQVGKRGSERVSGGPESTEPGGSGPRVQCGPGPGVLALCRCLPGLGCALCLGGSFQFSFTFSPRPDPLTATPSESLLTGSRPHNHRFGYFSALSKSNSKHGANEPWLPLKL